MTDIECSLVRRDCCLTLHECNLFLHGYLTLHMRREGTGEKRETDDYSTLHEGTLPMRRAGKKRSLLDVDVA